MGVVQSPFGFWEHMKIYTRPRRRSSAFKKQWIGRNANKDSLRRYCVEIWSELVRQRDNHQCFMCSSNEQIQAHHLITKKWKETAFEPLFGITLCINCHSTGIKSVHLSPWFLDEKLKTDRQEQYEWFISNRLKIMNVDTEIDYRKTLKYLLEHFEKIKPVEYQRSHYFRFNENEEKEIINSYTTLKLGMETIGRTWGCSRTLIEGILTRHGVAVDKNRKRNKNNTCHFEKKAK